MKFGVFLCSSEEITLVCEGEAEEIGARESRFWLKLADESHKREERVDFPNHEAALGYSLDALSRAASPEFQAVGHRVVHGGRQVREHQRVTPAVLHQLESAVDYAPLHLPPALAVLKAVQHRSPMLPQIVCLDTAFHSTMPDVAKTFPLPGELRDLGMQRYGFHGLSVESILAQLHPAPARLLVAHLGNGASITAVRNGKSMDNTMGLTPTGGVMMGTRCGDLDPGAIVYLMRHGWADATQLEDAFDHRSGLLGVSGRTSDVRELLSIRKSDRLADLALRMFCYQVRKAIGAMAGALGGLDTLVFTGGIGENAAELRTEICSGLGFVGHFETLVLPSREDLQIARITARLMEENG